jgi:phosphotriesterase-related protein
MAEAVEEVYHFYRAGGDTVVDLTPKHVSRDPRRLRAVARETGVQFVHGTGYYTESAHPTTCRT